MSKFTTAYGKDVATFVDPKTTMYKVKFVQGGELPEELAGYFTSERLADAAINFYIEKDKPQEKKVGRPSSKEA
jgi:hypothetical protein